MSASAHIASVCVVPPSPSVAAAGHRCKCAAAHRGWGAACIGWQGRGGGSCDSPVCSSGCALIGRTGACSGVIGVAQSSRCKCGNGWCTRRQCRGRLKLAPPELQQTQGSPGPSHACPCLPHWGHPDLLAAAARSTHAVRPAARAAAHNNRRAWRVIQRPDYDAPCC